MSPGKRLRAVLVYHTDKAPPIAPIWCSALYSFLAFLHSHNVLYTPQGSGRRLVEYFRLNHHVPRHSLKRIFEKNNGHSKKFWALYGNLHTLPPRACLLAPIEKLCSATIPRGLFQNERRVHQTALLVLYFVVRVKAAQG